MARLDPGGVPLRVRSRLASLRPELKAALVSIRDRVVRPVPSVASRSVPWLDELSPRLRGRVLVVGSAPMPRGTHVDPFDRLDPFGRGDRLRYLGSLAGDLLGGARYDAVVVVADRDDHGPMWESLDAGLATAWRAIDDDGGLLAVMVDAEAAGELDRWTSTLGAGELAAPLERRGAGTGPGAEPGPAVVVVQKAGAP